jgi:DNA-binding MarR family transcriptional regulator
MGTKFRCNVELPYTQSLLLYAYQSSARSLVAALREAGYDRIKPKHGAVFANIDPDGTRASLLAERAGIGKPAMGEMVDELEQLGYVRRLPDPDDRRAKLVLPTDAAKAVTDTVHRFNQALEAEYRRRLGDRGYEALRAALLELAPGGDPQPRMPPGDAD